jgi:hypothetical protein
MWNDYTTEQWNAGAGSIELAYLDASIQHAIFKDAVMVRTISIYPAARYEVKYKHTEDLLIAKLKFSK